VKTVLAVAAATLLALSGAAGARAADTPSWVAAWALPVNSSKTTAFSNKTIRMVERVSFGGSRVRVRLSDANGNQALTLSHAHVGLAGSGAAVKPGTDVPLTFGGASTVTIPIGSSVLSDPVDLTVKALDNVVVSPHLGGLSTASVVEMTQRATRAVLDVAAGGVATDLVNPRALDALSPVPVRAGKEPG